MTLQEMATKLMAVPLNMLIALLLLPMMLIEYLLDGLNFVASIGSFLQCEDKATAFKFITAYQTGALLKTKFPNSIAVRS